MQRCIELAKNGLGTTYPNPLVGSVLVHNNTIIGEGWHYAAGQPHAEVNAIAEVTNKTLLKEATIYVSLEPCSHYGKTPPCANLIISSGIKKVVIGCLDPNPKVAGNGVKKLKEAECEVVIGVLEEECSYLNKRFFTFQNKKRPYILLKWAQTVDGFIAPTSKKMKTPVWITNIYSRQQVHKMRAEEQAILVGTNTVLEDNPSLTVRDWKGTSPWRIVIDRSLKIPKNSRVYDQQTPTIFITEEKTMNEGNLFFEYADFSKNIPKQICDILYNHGIQSLIVEGGTKTLQSFISYNVWDEAIFFKGPINFTNGIAAPIINGTKVSEVNIKGDIRTNLQNHNL